MNETITLYHYWRSSCSWRVRWALALKGISYESKAVNLLNAEHQSASYLAINPSGLVPTLQVGQRFLSESLAIIEWLDELYPQPSLIPGDAWQRAEIRELCMMVACGIQPVQNLKIGRYFSQDQAAREAWNRHFIEEGFQALETKLKYPGRYCYGESITLADIVLVPQVYNALRFQVEMAKFPRIQSIYEHCLATPACEQAAPHKQEGAQG